MVENLDQVNEVYDDKLLHKGILQVMKLQIREKEVLISFYGDSNVGKSTILNSIMGNWYVINKSMTFNNE